jgi:hypothetical protein
MRLRSLPLWLLLASLGVAACDTKPAPNLAPSAEALSPATKATASALTFEIDPSQSKTSFQMNAPIEKINGEVADATTGQLFIDPKDIMKTTGLVKVDIDKLELFHQRMDEDTGEFGEREKNPKQNEHARNWLEIGESAPAKERELNRWVEYKIDKVLKASATDLTKLSGAERKITATVEGEFRLHQRKARKQAKVEATFKYDGDKLVSVSIKTTEPMNIGLEAFDVRPRELFGKLAQKTLSDLGQKVAKEAPIELSLVAKAK